MIKDRALGCECHSGDGDGGSPDDVDHAAKVHSHRRFDFVGGPLVQRQRRADGRAGLRLGPKGDGPANNSCHQPRDRLVQPRWFGSPVRFVRPVCRGGKIRTSQAARFDSIELNQSRRLAEGDPHGQQCIATHTDHKATALSVSTCLQRRGSGPSAAYRVDPAHQVQMGDCFPNLADLVEVQRPAHDTIQHRLCCKHCGAIRNGKVAVGVG